MSSPTPTTPPGHASAPPAAMRLAFAVVRWMAAAFRAFAHRRQVRTLLELNERELRDIGLTRGDVLRALHEPLDKDPSSVLLVRSVVRRSRLRAVAVPRRELSPAIRPEPVR